MLASLKKQPNEGFLFKPDFVEYKELIAQSGLEFNALIEGISIIKTSILLDPLMFQLILEKFRLQNSEERKRREKILKAENERRSKIESIKNGIIEIINTESFDKIMVLLGDEFEEICYSRSRPELTIKEVEGSLVGPEILGYDFKRIVKIFQERNSRLNETHFEDCSLFTTAIESFYRRFTCFYYVAMCLNHYQKDYASGKFNLYINRFIIQYGSDLKVLIYELSRYTHESSKIAMQNLFAVSEVPKLEKTIAEIKTLSDLDYSNLKSSSEDYFSYLGCRYKFFERSRKKTETEEEFLIEFFDLLNNFVLEYGNKLRVREIKITQEQLNEITELTYWEIQQRKSNEINSELISAYNRRLVELVDIGVKNATDFVLEIPKLQKMYLEKDYEGFFWTLNNIIGIEFIGSDGVNPNGNRVLESLKTQNFTFEKESTEIERKINLYIPSEIESVVDELKYSGNVESVAAAKKFFEIVLEIEMAGGVSQFWFNTISNKHTLAHKVHHGRNKNEFNFVGCALISLGGPFRVVIERKSNRIIFVGNYHIE
jgi:hypothetical protein